MQTHEPPRNLFPVRLVLLICGLAVFLGFLGFMAEMRSQEYSDQIMAHVSIGPVSLSGQSQQAALYTLQEQIDYYLQQPITLQFQNTTVTFYPQDIDLTYDPLAGVAAALQYSQPNNFAANLGNRFTACFNKTDLELIYTFDENKLLALVKDKLKEIEQPAVNATIKLENGKLKVTPEKAGYEANRDLLLINLRSNFRALVTAPVKVWFVQTQPQITKWDTYQARQVASYLWSQPLTVKYQEQKWEYSPAEIQQWIGFENLNSSLLEEAPDLAEKGQAYVEASYLAADQQARLLLIPHEFYTKFDFAQPPVRKTIAQPSHYAAYIGLGSYATLGAPLQSFAGIKPDSLQKGLSAKVGLALNEPGADLRLRWNNGKLSIKTPSTAGRAVEMDKLTDDTLASLLQTEQPRVVTARIVTSQARINETMLDSLGINELIGRGTSNFAGSPANRRFNIAFGAAKYDGLLIAPGEEFSFNKHLGPVDATSGFLPELVIKGNLITPEWGGGLCQVSTTAFRAAFFSGLNITERHNHSFVVSYYQYYGRAGADATIYIGAADLKFINDTPGYILIQTYVSGNTLTFDFYGTSDGRTVEKTIPANWGWGPGNSMKASWEQIVKNADGTLLRRQSFYSSYRPVTQFEHTN